MFKLILLFTNSRQDFDPQRVKEYDVSHFNLPLFWNSALFSRKSEKTELSERTLDHTHSFTNGVKFCHTLLFV